ncbi:MAG: hypothetical protein WED04_12010 [Promethearchaeati archaeon SRVP18_Atabeyarchaeia-1]
MQIHATHAFQFVSRRPERFLVTDLDNSLIDSRARFNRAVSEATGCPLTASPPVTDLKILRKEQRNKFYDVFLSGRYMDLDVPVKGSVEVLNRLKFAGLGIIYLTGRHHSRGNSLKSETLKTMLHYGYPMPDKAGVMLYLKPDKMSSTHEFKRRALERLARRIDLVVGVDDEPEDVKVMTEIVPLVIGVALSSQSAKEILSKVKVPIARDWLEVESIMKRRAII